MLRIFHPLKYFGQYNDHFCDMKVTNISLISLVDCVSKVRCCGFDSSIFHFYFPHVLGHRLPCVLWARPRPLPRVLDLPLMRTSSSLEFQMLKTLLDNTIKKKLRQRQQI